MKRLKCILLAAIVAAMMVPSFSFAALAQPGDDIESPTWSDDMTIYFPQQISKKYNGKKPNIPVAMFVNGKYEGLYKSALIDKENYLIAEMILRREHQIEMEKENE